MINKEARLMGFAIGKIVAMNAESRGLIDQCGFWGDAVESGFKVMSDGDES